MSGLAKAVLDGLSRLAAGLLRLLPPSIRESLFLRLLRVFCRLATQAGPFVVSVVARPKSADAIARAPMDGDPEEHRFGILVQGPLLSIDDYSFETVRLYRKLFPRATVLLSTWRNEEAAARAIAQATGCRLVLNEMPAFRGNGNVNLQLTTTRAGLRALREAGVEFALKTRTDQRLHSPYALLFLRSLLKAEPLGPTASGSGLGGRIMMLSPYSRLYFPQAVSDFLTFGHLEDVLKFWSMPLLEPQNAEADRQVSIETRLVRHFLSSLGWRWEDSDESHWASLRDIFCLVDHGQLDWFWYKYDYWLENRMEPRARPGYSVNSLEDCFSFPLWHALRHLELTPASLGLRRP